MRQESRGTLQTPEATRPDGAPDRRALRQVCAAAGLSAHQTVAVIVGRDRELLEIFARLDPWEVMHLAQAGSPLADVLTGAILLEEFHENDDGTSTLRFEAAGRRGPLRMSVTIRTMPP